MADDGNKPEKKKRKKKNTTAPTPAASTRTIIEPMSDNERTAATIDLMARKEIAGDVGALQLYVVALERFVPLASHDDECPRYPSVAEDDAVCDCGFDAEVNELRKYAGSVMED